MAKGFKIEGMKELERSLNKLGKVPMSVVTPAARAGAQIALKAAKANAPVDTGALRDGIILKPERRVKAGKKMYDVMMDPAKNDIFVKITESGHRYYYPASQEYGFVTVDGGYVPGYHFLRRSLTDNVRAIESKIVSVAGKAVDKALRG
ncbi:HK97-gp10 family putative phage morphogenesis protein [Cohnella sp. AR92]|uniref:HK97-gp10 family putative phage morphogenesis protein n=1 Tax=Cohnella sp. AR92 TaxID=648716 RepID=UPI000F8E380D|nr:HK97-gp10 family putative phage morphogenesis protein [Cohnella sp. AR92]RUS47563.1 HK97 gp10 family phage protein [Cohnella sp. AR92]